MTAREKLLCALEELLKEKDLDAIYVSEIISRAAVSRKTFYRNFQDKYDLANSYFELFFQETFGQIMVGEDWDTALLKYLEICLEKETILRHGYTSADRNGLRNCDIDLTRKTYERYLLAQGADMNDPSMKFAVEIASCGGTDMVIKWLFHELPVSAEELKNLLKQTLPGILLEYLA